MMTIPRNQHLPSFLDLVKSLRDTDLPPAPSYFPQQYQRIPFGSRPTTSPIYATDPRAHGLRSPIPASSMGSMSSSGIGSIAYMGSSAGISMESSSVSLGTPHVTIRSSSVSTGTPPASIGTSPASITASSTSIGASSASIASIGTPSAAASASGTATSASTSASTPASISASTSASTPASISAIIAPIGHTPVPRPHLGPDSAPSSEYFSPNILHTQVPHFTASASASSPAFGSHLVYPLPAAYAPPTIVTSPSLSPTATATPPKSAKTSPQARSQLGPNPKPAEKETINDLPRKAEETIVPRKKYACQVCQRPFTTSGHLARHNRTHTGERNHECPFETCTARFARQDNCMQHYKTHLESKSRPKRGRPPLKSEGKRLSRGSATLNMKHETFTTEHARAKHVTVKNTNETE